MPNKSRSKSPSFSGGEEKESTRVKIPKSLKKKIEESNMIMQYYMKHEKITIEDIYKDLGMTTHEYFTKIILKREFAKHKNSGKKPFEIMAMIREEYKDKNKVIADMKKNKFNIRESKE